MYVLGMGITCAAVVIMCIAHNFLEIRYFCHAYNLLYNSATFWR